MNVAPRRKLRLLFPLLALSLVAAPQAFAQSTTAARQTPARKAEPGARRKGDAKARARLARERREAVTALLDAASEARTLTDNQRSAEIQTFAADALWPHDEQAARAIFRRAWEAALTPTPAGERPPFMQELPERSRFSGMAARFGRAREIVLPTVAKRDPRLAASFIQEMTRALNEAAEEGEAEQYAEEGMGLVAWERLHVAESVLSDGEPKRAAEVAAPLVGEFVTPALVEFLLKLRLQSAPEADRLYLRMLEGARARPSTSANEVLLLSAHVVSQNVLMTVDERGSVYINSVNYDFADDPSAAPPVPPQLRAAFYDAAATILLRQNFHAGGRSDDEMRRAYSLYFAAGRLLPFFERESPQRAPELRARLAALSQEIEAARREALSAQMSYDNARSKNPPDLLAGVFEELARNKTDEERDRTRAQIVRIAASNRMWDRARRVADEITDAGKRSLARSVIVIRQLAEIENAYPADMEDDFERAARFVGAADAPPLARAAGMAQAAGMAARRGKRERAAELLNEAFNAAEQAERGTLMRAVAFASVATHAFRAGDARSWEALSSFVAAANAVDDYAGDEYKFPETDASPSVPQEVLSEMDVILLSYPPDDLFAAAARLDPSRALAEARALEGQSARAFATIAAARAALERPEAGGKPEAKR